MRTAFFLTLSFINIIVVPQMTSAQNINHDQIGLYIGFEGSLSDSLPLFVFIEGKLSGIVPGVILIPSEKSVPVEIGVAQLNRSPLYSFEFGPDVLKNNAINVVTTNIEQASSLADKNLILGRDAAKIVKLTKRGDNLYAVMLPSEAYVGIENFKAATKESGAFEVKKAEDYGSSTHLVFSKTQQRAVLMGYSANWSGTNMISFGIEGGIGYKSERQKWTIRSNPKGADIYTNTQPQPVAKTDSTVEVISSISSYAILKMDGYQQCVIQMDGYQQCTENDCNRTEDDNGVIVFTCILRKMR